MMKALIVMVVIWALASCAPYQVSDTVISEAKTAIDLCTRTLHKKAGSNSLADVDRVYVDAFQGGIDISFSHGAVGSFGERSRDQRSVWVCGVTFNQVVLLVGGGISSNPLVGTYDSHSYDNYEATVIELLFLRDGDKFKFHQAQIFDEKNLLKHNPDLNRNLINDESGVLLTE